MILLLGGTVETAPVATALAEAGFRVLVSTATDIPLAVGNHPNIERRCGILPGEQMAELIRERGIRAVVDATHPYATHIKATAQAVSRETGVPCFALMRPGAVEIDDCVHLVPDHEAAACKACSFGRAVLLTTGSRNLLSYVSEARRTGCPLYVRVLDAPASLQSCRDAGIADEAILTGRGPFSVDENRAAIRRFNIGVLVTKDGGAVGGVPEKIEAAKAEGCEVVVVARPPAAGESYATSEELVSNVRKTLT